MTGANDLPALMNSATYRPNGGPHGVLGAVDARRIGTVDSMKSHGVTVTDAQRAEMDAERKRTEHERLAALPDDQYHHELYRIFGKLKPVSTRQIQHDAIDAALDLIARDGKARNVDDTLALAADEYAARIAEQGQFYKERLDAMDAQPALPEMKPKSEPSAYQVWSEKFSTLYGVNAGKEFARATSWKNWHDAKTKGTLSDAEIVAMLETHVALAKRAADLDTTLGPDTPPDPPAQKPADKAPQSDATPAAVADVPAPRNDAPTAPETGKAPRIAPKPQPTRPTPKPQPAPKAPEYHPLTSAEDVRAKYTVSLSGKAYLQVAGRILLFRMDHKAGRIQTEMVMSSADFFVFKASIYADDGALLATGHAMATVAGSTRFSGRTLEKAETSAIGRALAHAGYGTDQAGEDVDEDDMLSDSPVAA